jgi:D-alanyl-lipoteichoic acid acyltransferase DltB (MBOAT superfamily)
MLFTSPIFLFFFLPLLLIVYFNPIFKTIKLKNLFLLFFSLLFYAWGEPTFVFVMIFLIIINYFSALYIYKVKTLLIITITINLGVLFIFKYLQFVMNNIFLFSKNNSFIVNIALPLGISFFTFQILSYIFDVYYGKIKANKNIIDVALYISCFPQLIAGPIVRYNTIINDIKLRKTNIDLFSSGVTRFIIGFSKKIILADQFALLVNDCFMNINSNSVSMAWLGAIAYTFQIYFDFSGYSDMAIGLGKMFGFNFQENFNYPYISKSITEFWRRWHISLGAWFKDYVYIPLGGNRVGRKKLVFNLFIVWLLVGIWHGANWTFVVWGMLYFVILVFEKLSSFYKYNKLNLFSKILRHIYVLTIIIFAWVIFRATNLQEAYIYIKSMLGLTGNHFIDNMTLKYIWDYIILIIIAVTAVCPLKDKIKQTKFTQILYVIYISFIFILSLIFVINGTFSPFIYFNF